MGKLPCVTSHHHLSDWELMKRNADGDVVIVASRQWAVDLVFRGVPSNRIIRLPYDVDCEAFSPPTEIGRRHISEKVFRLVLRPKVRALINRFYRRKSLLENDFAVAMRQSKEAAEQLIRSSTLQDQT